MSFIEELKRRNVVRVGIAYVIAAWLLLQLTEVLIELLDLPDVAGRFVILLLVIGFIPALIFAWAFEMTPEGIKREKDVDRGQSIAQKTGRKLDFVIIGILVVGIGYLLADKFLLNEVTEPLAANVSAETSATTMPTLEQETVSTPINPNSIAVLPFANRSNLEDDMFFTDGIHDDLLTQLAKIRDLKVISRTSVMKYKNTEKTIPEIAEELKVTTILEGGIQRAGKRIRINAQLIDVANDQHLWAETFDREMTVENIFDIQSEIARHIVTAVRGELTEEEKLNLARIPTNNLEAYEAYLQALAISNRADYSSENYIEAEIWATKAVELDPEFAQAWAMLVEIHAQATWIGYDTSPERFAMVKTALDNAIRFAPHSAETIAAQAEYQYRVEQNYKQSVETFKQALRVLPGDADIVHRLAVAQRRAGYFEDSIASFEHALELDPGHSRSPTTMVETLINMKQNKRAADLIDSFLLRYPDARDLRASKARTYMNRGDLKSARVLMDSMAPWHSSNYQLVVTDLPMLERDYSKVIAAWSIPEVLQESSGRGFLGYSDVSKAWAYRLNGDEATAQAHAHKAIEDLISFPRLNTYIDGFEQSYLAEAYALLGEHDKALTAANDSIAIIPEDSDMMFGTDVTKTRARVLGLIGKREQCLAEVERLLNFPTGFTRWQLYLDPRWDFMRDDERFNELVRPLDLEDSDQ
jgi:TolB-like protein/cytochrome c-type biogenesis protein CcmH/NrfG